MKLVRESLIFIAISCVSCFLNGPALAQGPLDLELQIKTGDQIPGVEGQIVWVSEASSGLPGNIAFGVGLLQPGGFYRDAFVIRNSTGLRKIIVEGEQLPGGAGALELHDYSEPYFGTPLLQMNSRGEVGLTLAQGVFLFRDGTLEALAVKGQPVPGTGSSIANFLSVTYQYSYGEETALTAAALNANGQMAFAAILSDGRTGVFLASRQAVLPVLMGGDPVPNREGLKFQTDFKYNVRAVLKGDHLTIGLLDPQFGQGIFHYAAGQLSTVLIGTDDIGGRGQVGFVAYFDGNENGTVALGINHRQNDQAFSFGPAELLLWSPASGIKKLLDGLSALPGIDTGARFFSWVSLDSEDRLAFAAEGRPTGLGFYWWQDGKVEKIVAEGDPAPTGGTFHLGYVSGWGIEPRPPGLAGINISPTNGRKEVAFMASGTLGGRRLPFLWSGGRLLPIPVEASGLPGFGDRQVTETRLQQLTSDGRLFLWAGGCCDTFQALYSTAPALPRTTYLPFFAAGSIADYSYDTVIQLANRSHFAGHVLIEAFQENGQAENPRQVDVEPGQVVSVSLADNSFRRGYARVTVEGGAAVFTEALIRASHGGNDFDLITPTTLATTKTDFVLDSKSQNTAVAAANPGSDPARITIRLFNSIRRLLATEYLTLAPHQQSSFLVTDLFGPTAGGDHRLRLECGSLFLAAAFGLNDFRFTPLPASPAASPASRPWSFVNVYPGDVEAVTASERGTIAFLTEDGRLMVVRDGIGAEVPKNAGNFQYDRLIGFREVNEKEELLFIGHSVGWSPRLLAWDGEESRSAIELEPIHLETGLTLYPTPERITELNRRGDLLVSAHKLNDASIVIGTSFLLYGGSSPRELFSLPDVTEVASVAFNSNRQVALITGQSLEKKTLGFFDGQEYRTIAEVGSQPLVDWWRPTDFTTIGLAEDGTTFFAANVRQSLEAAQTGLFAVKYGTIRTVQVGGIAPPDSFQVNSRGNLAFETRLITSSDSYGSTAFLVVQNTTLQTSVVSPFVGSAPPGLGYATDFQWTDNDELFFAAGPLGGFQSGLYCWKDGASTRLFDGSMSILNTPGAVGSPILWYRRLWPIPGFNSPIVSVWPSGDAPAGLYTAVRGGVRELFFPQVIGAGDESSALADLTVTNNGQEAAHVGLRAPDGNGGTHFAGDLDLSRKEDKSVDVSADAPFIGWLLARAVGGDVDARVGLSLFAGTSDYVRLAVPFSTPKRDAFTVTPPLNFGELGLAFANPYSAAVEVTVELLKSGLEVERQEKVQIGAQGQKSLYVSELFGAQVPGRLLRIRADLPVATFAAVQSQRGVAVQPVF